MLGVFLFVAFWVLVAFGLFFVAIRGGLGGARATLQTQSRGGRRAIGWIFAVVYLGFGVVLPITLLTGNHANANSQVGGIRLNVAQKHGRELFGLHCAVCHTLSAANAAGKVGPNLDTLRPPASLVLHTIQYGCLQSPPTASDPQTCLGLGVMPADVVEGKDAQDVASFVGKVAGKE
ncbi:MAG: c-type cytochrome [Solirubrobacteraceae bacterium]